MVPGVGVEPLRPLQARNLFIPRTARIATIARIA
jgi:hypothetical protein